ncbi:MAG: glycosyltransferase [Lachnospiraceae bacterium]|nr:glycosyltransferase [Lachnospiraceae bacterium]
MRQTLFVKYNRTRKPEYQIRTAIIEEAGERYVEKTALCLEGELHIHSFQKKYEQLSGQYPGVQILKPEFPEGEAKVRFPYLKGESLAEVLGREISAGKPVKEVLEGGLKRIFAAPGTAGDGGRIDSAVSEIAGDGGQMDSAVSEIAGEGRQTDSAVSETAGLEEFFLTPNFTEVFGQIPEIKDKSFHISNVDGLFENLMVTEEGLFAMDYEWVFDFPIPAGFLKYRNLHYFYERFKGAFGWKEEGAFLKLFGIEEELLPVYQSMEDGFQTYVHGDGSQGYLSNYQQPITSFEDLKAEEAELFQARERINQLQDEMEDKNLEIRKRNETQRLSNNHIANLEAMIKDLRHEIDEMGKLLTYLNRHEAIIYKVWRKFKEAVGKRFPKGTRKRKVLEYAVNTVKHPIRYGRLYLTGEGRNRIAGDFAIGSGYLEHGKLVFPKDPVKEPLVSIVIPVYNQIHYTYACLLSILEHTKDVSYEVIIADDVSTDATKDLGKYTENLVISRNSVNQGFLRNCNQAAMQARGRYIMFLNNDTQVTEGWLSSLVNLLESDPTIGMVGSKLVYPDGRLQEAGGILWSDGSGWNYGRLDDPDKAEYNYVKDVDYISGAAILLSVKLWKQIGGFDVRFAPAYCEDSDLAFEVRKAGYRVVYQPLSKVIHFEGVSNGTDVNGTGLKRYQVENSRKLKEKWAEEFKKQCVNDGNPNPFRARERSMGKPVILVIDHYVPTYDKDAGSKTTFQYLKMFRKMGYVVKFLGDNFLHEEPYSTTLQQMGIEILYGAEYQTRIWDWLKENGDEIAFAYLNRPHIASKYVDFIKDHTNIKMIYYGHDLHFLREMREYELTGDLKKKRDSDYWKSIEFSMMYKAAVSYYPSNVEVEAIHKVDASIPVKAITAYVYEEFLDKLQDDFEKREGLLFVGGFAHPPNADAVLWFAKEVFPLIRERMPEMKFYVVGSKVTEEIQALDSEENGIIIKGFVSEEELARLYASTRIVVVPLRYGAGVKGKVVEAIYNGAPIVTTSVGAEGIPQVETVLEIADEPQAFADAVAALYPDTAKLQQMCHKTQDYIREHFSVEAAWSVIRDDFIR